MKRHVGTLPVLVALLASCAGMRAVDPAADREAVNAALDDWHAAAAAADEERYFSWMAGDAVFLGTDPEERWTVEEFRAYAHPHFAAGRGWTMVADRRHVEFSGDAGLAWFDEDLTHAKYGRMRGTGVLRRAASGWKVVHYSLTFLIPNEVSAEVVAVVGGAAEPGEPGEPGT